MSPGEPLVPGRVLGFRQFRLDGEGRLAPLFAEARPWESKTTQARCVVQPGHRPPVDDCTCGLYAWHHPDDALVRSAPGLVVAAVRAHGRIVLGEHGFRAERAEITGVCLPRGWSARRRTEATALLRSAWPELLVFSSPRAFRAQYQPEGLAALGVSPERTSEARNHQSFGYTWVIGVIILYSVIAWPSAVGSALRGGGWVLLLSAFVAWQAWLVRKALA